jgi:PKD repeat protein
MQVVDLNSNAPVTIGNKFVDFTNNDQFHGLLDDAFMTVLNDTPPPNTPPVAAFTSACADFACTFDASTSTDDGPLSYAWDFADGGTDAVVAPTHEFGELGDHVVTLTVTDNSGLTSTVTHTVTIAQNVAPVAAFTSTCEALSCTFDASTSTDNGPLMYAWTFGDGSTATGLAVGHAYTNAGVYPVDLTVTDAFALSSTIQHEVTAVQPVVPTFVGQSSISAQSVDQVATVPSAVQQGDGMLLFLSVASGATVKQMTGVVGWVPVDSLTNANGSTRVWRKVAGTGDAGAQVRIKLSAQSKGNVTIVAYRGTNTLNPVAAFARTLVTTNSSLRTTPSLNVAKASVVVSYWMHRDGTTTSLTPPAGVAVRATGTQAGTGHVTVLAADSGAAVPVGRYGALTARAAASSTLATTWTIVLTSA